MNASLWSNLVLHFAKAVSVAENSPADWNNPCSLTGADKWSFATVGVGNSEGVWKFARLEDGWQAAYIKFDRMFRGKSTTYPLTMTIREWGMKYSRNQAEGNNVAAYLGITTDTTLQALKDSYAR